MAGGDVVTAAPLLPSVGSARLGVGYIIFFTLGAGFLLPWNAFVTAVDYFAFLYPGTPIDRVFSISYMVSGFLLLVVIVLFLPKSSAPIRINTGLTLFTLALLLVPAMDAVYVKGTPGLYGAFDITVAATFLCGVADALVQGGVIGFAGELLERYMHAVVAGTAASGDRYLKPYIIPVPEVTIVARAKDDECLILASDGLWDVMSNEEVCDAARKRILLWHKKNADASSSAQRSGDSADEAAQAAAEYLSKLALQKGSKDNITVIVVDLKSHRKFKSRT